jgi:predicted nucleic acid-binding protein
VILYLDTSALIKLYVAEEGTDAVREAIVRASVVAASRVAYVEARSALARARRESRIKERDFRKTVAELHEDWKRFLIVEVTDDLARQAGDIAERYGLRAYDALQLASALVLKNRVDASIVFLAFDRGLVQAAESAGLALL